MEYLSVIAEYVSHVLYSPLDVFFLIVNIILLSVGYSNGNRYLRKVGWIGIVYFLLMLVPPYFLFFGELMVHPYILLAIYLSAIGYFSEELFSAKGNIYFKRGAYLSAVIVALLLLSFPFMPVQYSPGIGTVIMYSASFFLTLFFSVILLVVTLLRFKKSW